MHKRKPPTTLKDNNSTPEFNSAIAFLEAIRTLINKGHEAMIQGRLLESYYYLKQLKTEIYPRLPITYDSTVLEFEKACDNRSQFHSNSPQSELNFRSSLNKWYGNMMMYIHRCKLIMPDKASELEATNV